MKYEGITAIQWHISDHFGLLLEGASGSVRITVKGPFVDLSGQDMAREGADSVEEGKSLDPGRMRVLWLYIGER